MDRSRVCIDHCEEHTIRLALDEGYWAGMTLYPTTKATPERAVDMIEIYGPERMLVNSSADWGPSDPLGRARNSSAAMRRRGHRGVLVPQDRLRQSAGVLQPEPQFPVRTIKGSGRRDEKKPGAEIFFPAQVSSPSYQTGILGGLDAERSAAGGRNDICHRRHSQRRSDGVHAWVLLCEPRASKVTWNKA